MTPDMDLVGRVLSARTGTVCAAIADMVSSRRWLIDKQMRQRLESREDADIDAWLFTYDVSSLTAALREESILAGLKAANARIREHACDLIGDLGLLSLIEELSTLFVDDDEGVRDAAHYNHDMLVS